MSTPEPNRSATARRREAPLTGRVRVGAAWGMTATVTQKGLGFVSQMALGWLLSKGDFGVFAAAVALAGFAQVIKEGGIPEILAQRGEHRLRGLFGPVFWMGQCMNAVAAGLVVLVAFVAPPLAARYAPDSAMADDRIGGILLVIALAILVGAPSSIYRSALRSRFRFGAVARMDMIGATVRHGSVIVFALLGYGPMSFALAALASAVIEGVVGAWSARISPLRAPRFRLWPPLFRRGLMLAVGMLATVAFRQGDYLLLGVMVGKEVLGLYFFAYLICEQLHMLIGVNLKSVLLPAIGRIAHEPERLASAVVRSVRVLSVVATTMTAVGALLLPLAEQLVFRGKWADAVPAGQLILLAFPMRMAFPLFTGVAQGAGRFGLWAAWAGLHGAGLLVVVWLAARYAVGLAGSPDDASVTVLASLISPYIALGTALVMIGGLRSVGVPARRTAWPLFGPWLIGLVVCVAMGWVGFWAGGKTGEAVAGLLYPFVYLTLLRLVYPGPLREVLGLAPARVSTRLMPLFRFADRTGL